jgi:hypothetical protein
MTPDNSRRSGRANIPGSWNKYAYALGDPIKYKDPRGREEYDPDEGDDCPNFTADGYCYDCNDSGGDVTCPEDPYQAGCDLTSSDTSSGSDTSDPASPLENFDRLKSLQGALDNALSHSDCSKVLGSPGLFNKLFGPSSAAQVLDSLIQGNSKYGSIVFGTPPQIESAAGETDRTSILWGTSKITINDAPLPDYFNEMTNVDAGVLILHELGHLLTNIGFSGGIGPDGVLTSQANTQKVSDACAKYLY